MHFTQAGFTLGPNPTQGSSFFDEKYTVLGELTLGVVCFAMLSSCIDLSSSGGRLRHRMGQILLVLFSPPLSLLYLCCLYHALFISSGPITDIAALLEGGVGLAGRGLVLAYNSWHFVGSWLFPVGCVAIWPVWLMGWRLACQTVREDGRDSERTAHPHSD